MPIPERAQCDHNDDRYGNTYRSATESDDAVFVGWMGGLSDAAKRNRCFRIQHKRVLYR